MEHIVDFKNVTYTYPLAKVPSIKNMTFQLEKGKFYGVIGANGSGKTTLCALIGGLAPSFFKGQIDGEIQVNGQSPSGIFEKGDGFRVGYVFQNSFNQISGIKDTVYEEIAFGLENLGVDPRLIEDCVVDVMEKTNTLSLAEKSPFALSGGQQQRVALASILVMNPDLYLIDEPTSQLDPESTEGVFQIIENLKKEKKTVVLVEHKVDLLAEYADEILVLDKGELIGKAAVEQVFSDLTLLERGVQLPQMAILGGILKENQVSLASIPITEKQAVEELKRLIHKKGGDSGVIPSNQ